MLASTTPTVTIGIPVYNREKLLSRTLDCLLAQSYKDFEILISDNASTDNTQQLCQSYAIKDTRIRYIRQPKNLGILGNFTFVKDNALGKYFMWSSSDDLCEDNFVEEMVNCLEANPQLALVMSDVKTVNGNGQIIHVDHMDAIRLPIAKADLSENRKLFFNYGDPNHLYHCIFGLYRTEVVKNCKLPRRTWRNMIADLEVPFLAQVAVRGGVATLVSPPLKIYNSHEGSTFVKEMSGRKIIDKIMRALEIRGSLFHTAFVNALDWKTRLQLASQLIKSSLWSASNFLRGKSIIAIKS